MRIIKRAIECCLLLAAAVYMASMNLACVDNNEDNPDDPATGKSVVTIVNNSPDLDVVGFYLVAQGGAKEQDWGSNLLPAPVPPGEQQDVGEFDTTQTYDSLLVAAPLDDPSATTEWPYPDVQLNQTKNTLYNLSDAGATINAHVPTLSSRWGESGYYEDPDWPYAGGWDFTVSGGTPVLYGVTGAPPMVVNFHMEGEKYPWSPEYVEGILDFGDGWYLRWSRYAIWTKTDPEWFSFEVWGHVYDLNYPPAWDTEAGVSAHFFPKFIIKRRAPSFDEYEATWTETHSVGVHVANNGPPGPVVP